VSREDRVARDPLLPHTAIPVDHDLSAAAMLWLMDLDGEARGPGFSRGDLDLQQRLGPADGPSWRRRIVVARRMTRILLARMLDRDPADLEFCRDGMGRPFLADQACSFNLSRSGGQALLGATHGVSIGVDLEMVAPVPALDQLAAEHLDAEEFAAWMRAAANDRCRTFLGCWTRKEACVKALGTGFRVAPRSVAVGGDARARFVEISIDRTNVAVEVTSLQLGPSLVGAISVAPHDAARTAVRTVVARVAPDSTP
jgi:4'-phosphopantetheinyl transferase